jgi:hypothetical protein
MKLRKTIKRIVALTTGATMLGATVLGAMAADLSEYPSPMFIKDGKFDGLIVIGADGDTQDMLGAMDIISSLQAVAVAGSSGSAATTTTVGDVYQFEKSSDKLNLGENMTDIRTKLSDTQLPIVLADGQLKTARGAEFDYEQEIDLTVGGGKLQHFADKDYEDEKPVIGFKIPRNNVILNYTLEFSKSAKSSIDASDNWDEFEDRSIIFLGEEFDIIGSDASDAELELMRGALKPTLEEGETATYTIDGVEYEVTALIIDDTGGKVKFKINGEVTDSMQTAGVYETEDGTLIGVRELLPNEAGDVTQDLVEFYMGAKKIKLTNGDELEIDDEDISNVDVSLALNTTTGTGDKWEIDKISLAWTADDDLFITQDGNEIVMPGLESIKLSMNGFYTAAEEEIAVYPSNSDTITLEAPLKDYDVSLDILYSTDSDADWDYVGGTASKRLISATCGYNFTVDMDNDEYFVISKIDGKEAETQVLELTKVHSVNGVTIKDYSGSPVAENKKGNKTFDVADMTFSVEQFNQDGSNATFYTSNSKCVNDTIVTAEGLKIDIPTMVNVTVGGGSNLTHAVLNVTEEDKDENIGAVDAFELNLTFNSDNEAHVKLVDKTNFSNDKTYSIDNGKVYVGYVESALATKVQENKVSDQYRVDIEYHGEEAYADLFLGSQASMVTTNVGGESVAATKIEVGAAVLDTSLATYTTQNLIVVGGPAINRAAAALLGKTYPAYGAESGIPENAALVKLVEQVDGSVAMIVAGWEADDSQRAARVVAESENYALSGMEVQVTGTSMTDISVGVPAVA